MKYCLSGRQSKNILNQADEIMLEEKDYQIIPDYFEQYPDKKIILIYNEEFIDKNQIFLFSQTYKENFIICVKKLIKEDIIYYNENNIKFYYFYPVSTFYDLEGLYNLGVEYIKITAPLTFEMRKLSSYKVKYRAVPNVAYDAYIPRNNGIYGQWIRPEDVEKYYQNIYILEFEDCDLNKEKALFDIYRNKKEWNGNLKLLISNLNHNVDNRSILPETGKMRSNCGQKCKFGISCHFCELSLTFNSKVFKYVQEKQNT